MNILLSAKVKQRELSRIFLLRKETTILSEFQDLTGEKFGRLIVLERADDKFTPCGAKRIRWKCICD